MVQGRTIRTSALALGFLAVLSTAAARVEAVARSRGGTLEMRSESDVPTADVTLRQVCRWGEEDAETFAPVADLVVARVESAKPFVSVKLDQVRAVLDGAGFNAVMVRFTGAAACTVSRSGVSGDNAQAFNQWAQAKEQSKAASRPAAQSAVPSTVPALGSRASAAAAAPSDSAVRTLRDQLISELADRLQLPAETLQVTFDPRDEKLLSMTNPPFKFQVLPRKVRNLGNVNWDVVVVTKAGQEKANIAAVARAWQEQLVAARPVSFKQILRPEDVELKRVLVDTLPDQPALAAAQAVGQQASLDLKIGTVLTANSVESVPLVRTGQLVTVTVCQGAISIKTAARAIDSATYGQPVKLRNEITKEIFEAVVTGQQEAMVGSPGISG